jgi:type I restriction enzyme R subunit
VEEGLTEEELALFDLLNKKPMGKAERERVKQASKGLLDALQRQLADVQDWTGKEQTQAEVEVFVLDHPYQQLPSPPFTDEEKQALAEEAYRHVWQQGAGGAAGNLNS